MKLLHTSDLRLGQGFGQLPELANALREARMETLRSILALAVREKVDAILFAGNTLADTRVTHDLVVKLTSLLATSSVPIYLWPGQTDPLRADSPYVLRADLFKPPVHVLRHPQLAWNGPLVSVGQELPGAEYVAVGGVSPEAFDFDQGRGCVRLVSFPGAQVQQVPIGRHTWMEIESTSLAELPARLTPLASETTLLRLKLRGSATLEEFQQFEAWRSTLRFQWLEIDNQMALTGGKRFHHPLLRALQENLEKAATQDPASARRASLQLDRLVGQSGKEDLV